MAAPGRDALEWKGVPDKVMQACTGGLRKWSWAVEGTLARRALGIQINVPAAIPMLYPRHTELGVPFSQSQTHKSSIHDWKKWW